ncbi:MULTISPECIES: hypothetical protein [Sorangium]|uniref:hypothetical protein n=1 Tax=Sorangium TaxID=39643 RepID=UPI003D9C1078
MNLADEMKIEPPCPKCGKKLKIPLSKTRAGMKTTCPSCGANIAFTGKGGDAADAMNKLGKSLERLGAKRRR